MTTQTKKLLKRTAEALRCIKTGKRFTIRTRKWVDPVDRTSSGFLRIDKKITTLGAYKPLEHHLYRSTSDDVRMLVAVLRDRRKSGQFWLWIWDSDRGVHIVEPAGTNVDALDKNLAQRFPNV